MSIATSILSLVPPLRRRMNGDETPSLSHLDDTLRQEALAARLDAECAQISALHRTPATYGFDEAAGWWVKVENWLLPAGMSSEATSLILMLPPEYPAMAPASLFVPHDLGGAEGWMVRDLLPSNEGNASASFGDGEWSRCAVPLARWNEADDLDRVLAALYVVLNAAIKLRLAPCITVNETNNDAVDSDMSNVTRVLPPES